MIDENGIVHIVCNPETDINFGRFQCGKTYTKDKRLGDEYRWFVRGTRTRRIPTCVVCFAVSFG